MALGFELITRWRLGESAAEEEVVAVLLFPLDFLAMTLLVSFKV